MQDTGITGRWHRARAAALGATAAVGALIATYAAWGGMLGELHRLERRSAVRTPDSLPVLLWAALVLALLWAAALIVLATATVLRTTSAGGSAGSAHDGGRTGSGPRPSGMIGRLAGVLLALTALSSLSTAAPAFAASNPTVASASAASSAATSTITGVVSGSEHGSKHAVRPSDSCTDEAPPAPGWVPDKPARTDQVARECASLVTGKPVADDSGEIVVHRGDTLWSIAAAHLGPHADAQAIAAEWPRWYAANRHVIGDDPDQLSIGTRLQTPDHALEGSNR